MFGCGHKKLNNKAFILPILIVLGIGKGGIYIGRKVLLYSTLFSRYNFPIFFREKSEPNLIFHNRQ